MILECVLLTVNAILPAKPVAKSDVAPKILTISLAAVATADGITTRRMIKEGWWEADPVSRAFIGRYPTWKRMVPLGAAEVAGSYWLAQKMRNSQHFHRIWWMPEAALITAHVIGIRNNVRLLGLKR